jgi:membrane-associated protein
MWNSLDSGIGQVASPILPLAIYLGIALIVVIENGLIFGFFLPGDLLLIAAGVFAGGYTDIDLKIIILTTITASMIGSQTGYFIGERFGKVLEKNQNTPSIANAIKLSHKVFTKSQVGAVLICNFIPGMRIFTPIIAGKRHMNRFTFTIVNIFGSVAWSGVFTSVGFALSSIDPVRENPFIVLAAFFLLASSLSMANFFRSL